jgi:uncharacterized membrane protein required for colicin V production
MQQCHQCRAVMENRHDHCPPCGTAFAVVRVNASATPAETSSTGRSRLFASLFVGFEIFDMILWGALPLILCGVLGYVFGGILGAIAGVLAIPAAVLIVMAAASVIT